MGRHERPFTPDTLAAQWECSAQTVRDLIHRGELRAFRVGRMFRIKPEAVAEYEARAENWQTSASEDCEADSAPTGMMRTASDDAISLRLAPSRKRRPKQ